MKINPLRLKRSLTVEESIILQHSAIDSLIIPKMRLHRPLFNLRKDSLSRQHKIPRRIRPNSIQKVLKPPSVKLIIKDNNSSIFCNRLNHNKQISRSVRENCEGKFSLKLPRIENKTIKQTERQKGVESGWSGWPYEKELNDQFIESNFNKF